MTTARSGRAARLLVALAGAVLLTGGCASIPSSSPPQVFPENPQPTEPADEALRYDPIRPRPGESPVDIVKDYLAVGGSHQQQHAGARAYLTAAAARKWKDTAGVVALEDAPIYLDEKGNGEVSMRATQHGRIDVDGSYLPNSAPYPYTFRLVKVDGEWRIDNPPPVVLVTESTFERAWRSYNVFFLDHTRSRVVPDVRMVPYPQDNALPSLLMNYLANGPSAGLEGAVRSDLEGVRLQRNVVRGGPGLQVFLTGLDETAETLDVGGFAQIVWTLNQVGVGGIEILMDGRPIAPRGASRQLTQRLGDWREFDPEGGLGVSTPGYFIRDGAVRTTTAGQPVGGQAGSGAYRAESVGVPLDQRSIAVVVDRPGGGVGLYVGAMGGALKLVLTGRSMTPPTWGPSGDEVWTVKDGREVVLVQTNGQTSRVIAPALESKGAITALRLSFDGARVAAVAGPAKRDKLYLGVVVRQNGGAQIEGVRSLDVGIEPVSDVVWSEALAVTVLVRGGQEDSGLYRVSIDGRTSGQLVAAAYLGGPPSAVAAAPKMPLLAIAAGTVWTSPGSGEAWKRLTRGPTVDSAVAYPG